MSKKRGFNCPICDEIFSQNDLENHVQNHFEDSEGQKAVVGMFSIIYLSCMT